MKALYEEIYKQRDYVVGLRRELHRHPELSLQEFWTAGRIEEELDRWGIPHERIGETGVLGRITGEGEGAWENPCIILRADIDALPIFETNDVPYRSQIDGVMHACGHDAHTACLLGAAKLLQEKRDSFGGEIRLCFQQAEEIGAGAMQFIDAGVMEGAQRVFGLHTAPDIRCGKVGVKKGANNASVDHFKIQVKGSAAHVSTPQKGVDALYIASQLVVALQALVTRRTSPVEPLIIGVGKLTAGTAYNIVAEDAELEGTVRAISHETRQNAKKWIDAAAEGIAALYGGEVTITWKDFTSPLINDDGVCEEVGRVVEALWGAESLKTDRKLSLGGDDIAEFILRVPGAYAFLGTGSDEWKGSRLTAHNGGFDIDEHALPKGVALYVAYALEYLQGRTARA